jgi:HAE1 family hydrophobic/amphiphilic exporter-1
MPDAAGSALARFSVRKGVLVNILFVVCLLAGYYGVRHIAVDAYPNVDLDAAAIYTVWIGASPEEIDNLVTARVEDELEGIRGIDRIVSDSRPNRSSILVKFRETLSDSEVDRAFQDIRAAMERIDDLPEEAERPRLVRQTVFEIFPLVSVAVSYDRPELEPVARAVARELREELFTIDGVAKIDDRDLREPEYTVLVDRTRLERYDVTLEEVVALAAATNRNVPAGELARIDGDEYGIKAAGNYLTARDLEETVIRQDPDGAHILVRDVARVVPGFEERDVFSRFNGRDAVILPVSKEEGRNSLELVDTIRPLLDDFTARGLPEGLEIGIPLDSSQIIRDRLNVLLSNLATGMILVFLALWMGIGVRNAILAIIGVPFCYLVSVLFMGAIDVSLNAISLFAMVLVSGVIVDDALIVLENVYRHLEEKVPLKQAVIRGSAEVFWPIVSSTLTTISAFLPMLLMLGVTGEFFSIIPKVVVVTLIASLFECFVVLPVHYLDFGQRLRKKKPHFTRPDLLMRVLERARNHYERALAVCLRHRYATVIWLLAAAIFAIALWGTLDTVLFPSDFQVFLINMEMPTGASLEQTADASKAADELLALLNREGPYRGQLEGWSTTLGAMFTEDNYLLLGPHVAQAFVSLRQGTGVDPIEVRDYAAGLLARIRTHPEGEAEERMAAGLARFRKVSAVPQQDGPPTGKPVAVRIRCDDLDEAESVATQIKAHLETLPGVLDVADNHDEGRIEYSLALREELAAAQGITFNRAARTLVAANDGIVVSVFKDPGGLDDADVRVRLDPGQLRSVGDLGRVRIRNQSGIAVPLASIGRLRGERSHAGIYRYDGRRTVVVTADVQETVTTAVAVNENLRAKFDTPAFAAAHPDIGLRFGGEFEETRKSFESLGEAFKVAVLAIYMILAAQFRSYALPLVILLTVPFAFIGVVVGLFVTGNPFTIMAGIAMVGLAGIAVNDAIVLVDFIRQRTESGMELLEAVRVGCRLRARPILLTSVTTIAGLLPMALGLTGFSKLWSPFAATICFGILFSTLLTLLIVPSGYVIVEDLKARWRARKPAVSD